MSLPAPSGLDLGGYDNIGLVVVSVVGTAWTIWRDPAWTRETALASLALAAIHRIPGKAGFPRGAAAVGR